MPIERAVVLRNAEKLVRQGKVDLAIAEYLLVAPHGLKVAQATLDELQSEAGHYRDVAERVDRLFKAQPRG